MAKKTGLWKDKAVYKILAPENFDYKELGSTVSSEPKLLLGRSVSVFLSDLLEDRSKQHLKLTFEISEIKENAANTKLKEFSIVHAYLRSRMRKSMGKTDYVRDLQLQDSKVRMKIMVITPRKLRATQKKEVLDVISKTVDRYKGTKLEQFVQLIIFGKLGTEIYQKVKKITPIHRVEVWELKLLKV